MAGREVSNMSTTTYLGRRHFLGMLGGIALIATVLGILCQGEVAEYSEQALSHRADT